MNQSQPNDAGGFAESPDCHAANGQIGYQNIKTVSLDASNEGVRYTPVGAPSIDKNTMNSLALCADPIRARGQFGTQNTPGTILSDNSEPTHVTRHCARPVQWRVGGAAESGLKFEMLSKWRLLNRINGEKQHEFK